MNIALSPAARGHVSSSSSSSNDDEFYKQKQEHYQECEKFLANWNPKAVHTQEEVNRYLNCPQAPSPIMEVAWIIFLVIILCAIGGYFLDRKTS